MSNENVETLSRVIVSYAGITAGAVRLDLAAGSVAAAAGTDSVGVFEKVVATDFADVLSRLTRAATS